MEYSYRMFNEDMFKIQEQIEKSDQQFTEVIGLARGGVIAATVLSHRLDLPLKIVDWSFRDHKRVDYNAIDNIQYNIYSGRRKYLIIDDILDSGETLDNLFRALECPEVSAQMILECTKVAVLIQNSAAISNTRADYRGRDINRLEDSAWVNFWWEEK